MKRTLFTFILILLVGCESIPIIGTPEPPGCPPMEPVQCPTCEARQCEVCAAQQCPEPQVVENVPGEVKAVPTNDTRRIASGTKLPTIGSREWARVEPANIVLEARIDTGAETSSIHAENIQLLEKDGKRYVKFTLHDPETGAPIPVERRLHRRISVKQKSDGKADRRYVVRMWVTLGETRTWVDVSLSDRDDFEFPLLIGRNMLMDSFAVDVSQHHTLPKLLPLDQ